MTRFTNNNKLSLPIAGYENYTIKTSGGYIWRYQK